MIKIETCRGCGRLLYSDLVGGLKIRAETEPLEADGALPALLGGQTLYRVVHLGGRPSGFRTATPDVLGALRTEPSSRPHVVREHVCPNRGQEAVQAALSRPNATTPGKVTGLAPKVPARPTETRSSGLSAADSPDRGAPTAGRPRFSRSHRCDECGEPVVIDGPAAYCAIELGATVVWAVHAECPAN